MECNLQRETDKKTLRHFIIERGGKEKHPSIEPGSLRATRNATFAEGNENLLK